MKENQGNPVNSPQLSDQLSLPSAQSTPARPFRFFPLGALALGAMLTVVICVGCGGSGNMATPAPSPNPLAATITQQPVSQGVRLGDTATFSVKVSGSDSASYQWNKNGTPIPGAVAQSYTTPPTVAPDNDSLFSVTVTTSPGLSQESTKARLLLNAPKPGDLRFQQVDARTTMDGYTATLFANISATSGDSWNGYGSPLQLLSFGQCGPNVFPVNCAWFFFGFSSPGIVTTYQGDLLSGFQSDLNALPENAVITSLDFEPANNGLAMSWVQSDPAQSFTPLTSGTALPADFPAIASQEGALGHVITGVASNAGVLTYVSFGWQSDTTTKYEAQIATAATINEVPNQALALAQSGYIVTAMGGDASNGYLLVGTRVQGDTMPRPFKVVDSTVANPNTELYGEGYALIGTIDNLGVGITFMGEK